MDPRAAHVACICARACGRAVPGPISYISYKRILALNRYILYLLESVQTYLRAVPGPRFISLYLISLYISISYISVYLYIFFGVGAWASRFLSTPRRMWMPMTGRRHPIRAFCASMNPPSSPVGRCR